MKWFASSNVTPTDFSHPAAVLGSKKEKGERTRLPLYDLKPNTFLNKNSLDLSLRYFYRLMKRQPKNWICDRSLLRWGFSLTYNFHWKNWAMMEIVFLHKYASFFVIVYVPVVYNNKFNKALSFCKHRKKCFIPKVFWKPRFSDLMTAMWIFISGYWLLDVPSSCLL